MRDQLRQGYDVMTIDYLDWFFGNVIGGTDAPRLTFVGDDNGPRDADTAAFPETIFDVLDLARTTEEEFGIPSRFDFFDPITAQFTELVNEVYSGGGEVIVAGEDGLALGSAGGDLLIGDGGATDLGAIMDVLAAFGTDASVDVAS